MDIKKPFGYIFSTNCKHLVDKKIKMNLMDQIRKVSLLEFDSLRKYIFNRFFFSSFLCIGSEWIYN